jgi:hypothetical protein
MSWRELMKTEPSTQYSQNTQKEPQRDSFGDIEDIGNRTETIKVAGYGCGNCGYRIYRAAQVWEMASLPETSNYQHEHTPVIHWQCEGCGAAFEIIGGIRGPKYIN